MLGKEISPKGSDVQLGGRIFIALVVDNLDEKGMERIKVRVIGVHDMDNTAESNAVWAHHCAPSKWKSGEIPEIGDYIYVQFMDPSDPMAIIWLGFVRTMF